MAIKPAKNFLLFNEADAKLFVKFNDAELGFIFRCAINYYLGQTKDDVLNEIDDTFKRGCIESMLNGLEARKLEYERKCAKLSQNAQQRWNNERENRINAQSNDTQPKTNADLTHADVLERWTTEIRQTLTPELENKILNAEAAYTIQWVYDALKEASLANIRNWRYVEGILRKWQEWGGEQKPADTKTDHESIYANLYKH